ncbi:uncharacterized protein K452DRAFT_236025, partial [Aplosporella prunicola CBS 121167]
SRKLPLARNHGEDQDYYHECQLSLLVTGVDEWFWTGYCLVDTYYGSEEEWSTYFEGDDSSEPATGGASTLQYPIWNPREYFLAVLARRMAQATLEWRVLVTAFKERMEDYEDDSLLAFVDDTSLTRTKQLMLAVSSIRRFRDSLARTISAWDTFGQQKILHLETTGSHALRQKWEEYIESVRSNISELKSLHLILSQKLDLFNSMRDGLVNASSLKESADSTRQGVDIGILTRMTVLYLPLSLATSAFSIAMVSDDVSWIWYGVVIVSITLLTLFAAANPRALDFIFYLPRNIQQGTTKMFAMLRDKYRTRFSS